MMIGLSASFLINPVPDQTQTEPAFQGTLQGRLSKIQCEAWWELQGRRAKKERSKKVKDSHGAVDY